MVLNAKLRQQRFLKSIIVKGVNVVNASKKEEVFYEYARVLLLHPPLFGNRRLTAGTHVALQCQCTAGGHCTGAACPAGNYTSRVVCPDGSFARVMRLMRYLCENGIGPGQWLDVLDDLHQPYRPLAAVEDEPGEENSREFVPFAGFNTENLLHNTELTQSV